LSNDKDDKKNYCRDDYVFHAYSTF